MDCRYCKSEMNQLYSAEEVYEISWIFECKCGAIYSPHEGGHWFKSIELK